MRKPAFCICENKDADQLAVTPAKLISAFVFATWKVQSRYYLHPKFQASSHLLWLYSPVCVGPGQKPRKPVFSERGSYLVFDSFHPRINFRSKSRWSWKVPLICVRRGFTCVRTVIWHFTERMGRRSGSGILNNISRTSVTFARSRLSRNVSERLFKYASPVDESVIHVNAFEPCCEKMFLLHM